MRLLLLVFAGLTLLATNQLYALSEHTERAFAWSIEPPLTAAFLGGGYGAGFVLVVLSLRSRSWASTRVGFLTVLVFALMTLIATLLHLDRFHFDAVGLVPRAAAWIWLLIYVVVPIAMLALLASQWRVSGREPSSGSGLGVALKVVLGLQGAALLVIGVSLFVVPQSRELWPWSLTPLTAQSIASWLIALGVAGFLAILEDDLQRLRPAAATYTVLALLQSVAVVRYHGDMIWTSISSWVYVLSLLLVFLVGVVGVTLGSPSSSREGAGLSKPRSGRRRGHSLRTFERG
jgi:hypothetical protein